MATLRCPPLRVWVWTAATLVLVVVATLLWRGSDAAATSRSTAAPAVDPTGSPAGALSQAWTRTAGVLPEQVVAGDRVIMGDRHGITALDPATGDPVWHYTRSNAVLCGVTATEGVAVAVFRTRIRCDQAVALHADTGGYAWTRSVDLDSDVTLRSTRSTVLAVSRGSVVVIDPLGDNIRWRSAPHGCSILDAVPGSSGIAVLLRCPGTQALRVRLLDGGQGNAAWTQDLSTNDGSQVQLAGADGGVAVVVGDELQFLSAADGTVTTVLPLPAAGQDDARPMSAVAGPLVLTWARGTLVARASDLAVLWQVPALGLPTPQTSLKALAMSSPLLVPEEGAFVALNPSNGQETGRSSVDGPPTGGVATPIGDVVVYRLPDRVIAYR
ncbi:outer membrane protein assembly factor BamB family protein [Petropleomorpha daqingensis]|uniref:Outer membrane protein assembly factor BamB n=1 Tax=Petropleomorpha daqingensis TaxID=2026353 RepID=A0A853CB52_9ACTN|nr:outer membrane protein assembly factor BamB [Petropleomorpha daqingensis]